MKPQKRDLKLAGAESKEDSVLHIWENHWATSAPAVAELLSSRFTQEAFKKINRFVSTNEQTVLEIGCGTGRFCTLLAVTHPNLKITGVDLSESALRVAKGEETSRMPENLCFRKADLFDLPFPDNHFDLVFSEGVIQHFSMEHYPTYIDALTEMVRVLKPGGRLIVSVVNWHCFAHTFYKWALHRMGRSYEYGYEKSFKRKEIKEIFLQYNLKHLQFVGYYPAHAFYRHAGKSRLLRYAGIATDVTEAAFDCIKKDWFSTRFGFEIIATGIKPGRCPID